MAHGNIRGTACLYRQRNAHQPRLEWVETGGFGINCSEFGGTDFFQPGVQLRIGVDHLIVRLCRCSGRHKRCVRRWLRHLILYLRSGCLQFLAPRLEIKVLKQHIEFRRILHLEAKLVKLDGQFDIAFDGEQTARGRQPIKRLAQISPHHTTDLVSVRHHIIERAELRQPFHRGLGTHLGHARHVIDRIADQRQVIDDAFGPDAEFFFYCGFIERFIGHGVDQHHLRRHQLRDVLVTSGNHYVHAVTLGGARQGTDHVVGFHAFHDQQRPAHGGYRFVQWCDLAHQVIRHRRAIRLVLWVNIVAKGLALGVEHTGA